MVKSNKPSIEQILAQLESTIRALEENCPIEESLSRFEEGVKLVKTAQKRLQESEQRVQILVEKNGEPEFSTLQVGGDSDAELQ